MPYIDSHPMLKNLGAAAFISFFSLQAAAQDELSELDYLNDIEVTFAATRLPQQLKDAPASVTIIDRTMIEASSATNVTELMRLVPGLQSYHISTNAAAVSYHGMSDKFPPRMEVMIDGRSVYIPLFSAVIWETLPLSIDDIERIEIVRGTNTVTQGSNAFLGAINIITHSALGNPDNLVKYTSGEFNNQTYFGRYSGVHDLGFYSLSASISGNEGHQFSNGDKDPYFNRYITFKSTFSPTLYDTISFDLGASSGYSIVGDIISNPNLKRREFNNHYESIEWKRSIEEKDLNIHYSHSYNDFDARLMTATETGLGLALGQALLDINKPFKITGETGKIEQHDLEVSLRQQLNDSTKIINGISYRNASAKNRQLLDTLDWVNESSLRLFSNLEYQKNRWIYNLGLTGEKSDHNGSRVSPRIAANYQLSDTSSIRSSVSRAYRMPSLLEANYQSTIYAPAGAPLPVYDYGFTRNSNLKPEQLDSVDIGFLASWPDYHSSLDLRIFLEEISNGITENEILSDAELKALLSGKTSKVHIMDNTAQWQNKGFEAQYKYQSHNTFKPLLVLSYGYIETSGTRVLSEVTNRIDPLETRNPTHTASLLTSVTLPSELQVSLSHYFLSSVQWIEAHRNVNFDPPNSPYHRTDLKISQKIKLTSQNELSIALIVQNLLDNPYSEFYAENIFEQRTYVQAQLSF
jgi:iron complex outermembrane receptor protein